ncbi:HypA protein [Drechmeria coniospora]|uniref:HypA protein n=1 Tax=Drechmeria coniospora TaxID=98403 RepID=A0A151GI67_DRECN|nr:HypA protein [Drechmeria coniospora]KYK56790.1 HypA protein [Drechmeria coniospora]
MATPYQILVRPQDTGLLRLEQDAAAAAKVTELLQKDLERHHVFFNAEGFHNHIPHHLLALYGTGATPAHLQTAFDTNASYQIKAMKQHPAALAELRSDWSAHAHKYLGLGKHYSDFLAFFQSEIQQRGWQAVVKEFLFDDTPKGVDMLGRLYSGFLHPMIQLMYGLEWEQPAVVAEGLAQAAVHEARIGQLMTEVDDVAAKGPFPANRSSVVDMCETVRASNPKLATSARWEDPNRIYDGVLARARDDVVALMAQIRVKPEELEERTAEMFHTAVYIAAAAAVSNPPHIPKLDFFLMSVPITSEPPPPLLLPPSFNAYDWVPLRAKVRMLEWKMRMDCVQYLARGAPPLAVDAVRSYTPPDSLQLPVVSHPRDLIPCFRDIVDDGHLIKVVRSLLLAQEVSRPWQSRPWLRIRNDDEWLKLMYMLLGSVHGQPSQWIRSAGFKEAWTGIPEERVVQAGL